MKHHGARRIHIGRSAYRRTPSELVAAAGDCVYFVREMQSPARLLICFSLLAAGCGGGGKGSPAPDGSTGGTGGSSATGGTGGGTHDAGTAGACASQKITSAPSNWVRPANCGGIGNFCSDGCSGAACQSEGYVCIPFAEVGASPTACNPYCEAFACMTFDEASCFCTGEAAAQYPACACGPAAVAGLCAAEGASCATTPCCDCQGLTCVTDSVSGTVCRQPCSSNTDCATGCCDTTAGTCHDAIYCTCVGDGQTCGSGGPDCCPGSICLTYSADGSGPFNCYAECHTQADCKTGCCSSNIAGQDFGDCGPCQ